MAVVADAISGTSGEAVKKYRLLKHTGSQTFKHCQPGDTPVGANDADVDSAKDVTVHLIQRLGSLELESDGAISVGARVYPGLNGRVSANAVGRCLGLALTAAATVPDLALDGTATEAHGDVIEVLPLVGHGETEFGDTFEVADDFFFHDATEGPFVVTGDAGAGGTTDVIDGVGGIMSVVCDGDDNDEKYLHTIKEYFKVAAGKPIYFEARVAFTEGAVNKAAILVGLMDAPGADALVDTEGGPKASYSGVVFWKVAGTLLLSAEASIAAVQTPIVMASAPAHVSATHAKYGILIVPVSATKANVYLFINGTLVGSITEWTYTGATEMGLIVGVKSDGSAEETALVDYIRCRQAR